MRQAPANGVALALSALLCACGGGGAAPRMPSATQALTQAPEALEFESPTTRAELFREIARQSELESTRRPRAVLFPVIREGELLPAPGFDPRADLFSAPDAGAGLQIQLDGQWSTERKDSLQGLSEREAVELVARTLLIHWRVRPTEPVLIERTPGAPYAVAYVDGVLRVNPVFVYLAAAALGPSTAAAVQ